MILILQRGEKPNTDAARCASGLDDACVLELADVADWDTNSLCVVLGVSKKLQLRALLPAVFDLVDAVHSSFQRSPTRS